MNPGHAIEAGWMLLKESKLQNLPDLQKTAINHFIMGPLDAGWDKKFGGIFYFLDVDGHDPIQLEWSMKLWWVHCETLISLLMAYQTTGDNAIWGKLCEVLDYTLKHVRVSFLAYLHCEEHFSFQIHSVESGMVTLLEKATSTRGSKEDHLKVGSDQWSTSWIMEILYINRMLPRSSLSSDVLSHVRTFAKTKYS